MPRNSQASSKRAKTHNEDAQRPHDLSEERSQVAGLVEKRRLQNRISQRNYRTYYLYDPCLGYVLKENTGNRIRDRLEALEALVDTTTTGHSMNPSQPSDNARFTSSENADRSTDGAQSLPLETSSILSTENFHTWNTANLQNSSSAQTSGMYHFMDPCLSVDGYQQAKTGAATTYSGSVSSTGASTPASYPYPAPTSAHPFRNQSVITKLEELDSSMRFSPPFENENSPNHPSPSDTSPQTPVDHSASSNTLTFGYPMTPMSMASQQQTPKSFPGKKPSTSLSTSILE